MSLLNGGGEIRASGAHPENRPWNIYISRFGDVNPQEALALVSLNNEAIATSGDYLQTWSIEKSDQKITYFHVLDPHTLKPLEMTDETIASVSVVAPSCTFADGLATALMLFSSREEATYWLENKKNELQGISFWIYSRNTALRNDIQTR